MPEDQQQPLPQPIDMTPPPAPTLSAPSPSDETPTPTNAAAAAQAYSNKEVSPPPAVQAAVENHGVMAHIGHAVHQLFTGYKPPTYHLDESGQPVEDPRERETPGTTFRTLLASAILGFGAGLRGKNPGEGASLGLGAVLDRNDTQDAAARQRAQQGFENKQKAEQTKESKEHLQLEKDRFAQQKIMDQATITSYNWTHIKDVQRMQYEDQAAAEHSTAVFNTMNQFLVEHKAKMWEGVDGNGAEGDAGQKLLTSYTQHPENFKQEGFTPLVQKHINFNGLKYNPDNRTWYAVADKDKTPVNLQAKTTVTIFKVPDEVMKGEIDITGADLMKTTGALDLKKDQIFHVPAAAWLASVTHYAEQLRSSSKDDVDGFAAGVSREMAGLSRYIKLQDDEIKAWTDPLSGVIAGLEKKDIDAHVAELRDKRAQGVAALDGFMFKHTGLKSVPKAEAEAIEKVSVDTIVEKLPKASEKGMPIPPKTLSAMRSYVQALKGTPEQKQALMDTLRNKLGYGPEASEIGGLPGLLRSLASGQVKHQDVQELRGTNFPSLEH